VKPGDLVRCDWQPGGRLNPDTNCVEDMKYQIKGELGILLESPGLPRTLRWRVLFPRFGYTHTLATSAFKLVSCA
jgi:hypothetical protein